MWFALSSNRASLPAQIAGLPPLTSSQASRIICSTAATNSPVLCDAPVYSLSVLLCNPVLVVSSLPGQRPPPQEISTFLRWKCPWRFPPARDTFMSQHSNLTRAACVTAAGWCHGVLAPAGACAHVFDGEPKLFDGVPDASNVASSIV